MVPAPALGVEVMVGGVAVMLYDEVYEPPSMARVREASVTENETVLAVAAAYVPSVAMVAPMVQVPGATKATRPLEAFTVQTDGVELE